MSDTDEAGMFDEFADATEAKLTEFAEQIRAFRAEMATMREEQRSARLQTPAVDVVDMQEIVTRAAALVPVPKDGAPGANGKDGKDAEPVDRVSLAKDVLALIPVPRDGKDGIASLDDLRAEVAKSKEALRDQLPILAKAAVAEARANDPWPVYRDIWREGEYEKGAVVTWAGAAWIARDATDEKPGDGATKWKLFLKKGQDGKDAR